MKQPSFFGKENQPTVRTILQAGCPLPRESGFNTGKRRLQEVMRETLQGEQIVTISSVTAVKNR